MSEATGNDFFRDTIETGLSWISNQCHLDELLPLNIQVSNGKIYYYHVTNLTPNTMLPLLNSCREILTAKLIGVNIIDIIYREGNVCETIHIEDLLRREWVQNLIQDLTLDEIMLVDIKISLIAVYNVYFPSKSQINFDTLEKVTNIDFTIEKNFKKPKNRKYATVQNKKFKQSKKDKAT